jgi:hypothetical protein
MMVQRAIDKLDIGFSQRLRRTGTSGLVEREGCFARDSDALRGLEEGREPF